MAKKTVVIVGGGTAGIVIANNLQDYFDVIVIEKSKYLKYPKIYEIPLLIGFLYRRKVLKYITKRELGLAGGRRIPFFESNVLGGASVINGCVHVVGSRRAWSGILQNYGADYSELIASYDHLYAAGVDGKNKINLVHAPQNGVDKAFIKTLNTYGVPIGDMNFSESENCGPIYDTARKYFRSSVMSLLTKRDFSLSMNEEVERILIDDKGCVTGVQTDRGVVRSDYVVLSGGVIGTCGLLLRQKDMGQFPEAMVGLEIGRNIQDHTNIRVNVITKNEIGSLNEIYGSILKKVSMFFRHLLGHKTLMVGTGATSGAHLDLDGDGVVDTRIQVVQFTESGRHGSDGKYFLDRPGFSLSITPIHPLSSGEIKVSGQGVTVDPNYLSQNKDVELLKLALSYCLRLLRTEPLSSFIQEIVSEDLINDDPEAYIRENFYSGHHLIGGAHDALGKNFDVKGVKGLYVCDASIFNAYSASNIHSSVVLIADIFSKRFISNYAEKSA